MKLERTRETYHKEVQNRETMRDERVTIVALRDKANLGWTQIGEKMKMNPDTCQKIHERWQIYETPFNRHRKGRPLIFNDAEKQMLKAFVISSTRTRQLSWDKIKEEMGYTCSWKTICKAMSSLGYHKRVPCKK